MLLLRQRSACTGTAPSHGQTGSYRTEWEQGHPLSAAELVEAFPGRTGNGSFQCVRPSRKSSMFPVSRPTLRNRADPVTFYAFRNKIKSVPTDPLRMYDFFIILYLKVYVTILLR